MEPLPLPRRPALLRRRSRWPSWPSGSARRCTSTARRRSWSTLEGAADGVRRGRSAGLLLGQGELEPGHPQGDGRAWQRVRRRLRRASSTGCGLAGGDAGQDGLRRGGQDRRGDRRRARGRRLDVQRRERGRARGDRPRGRRDRTGSRRSRCGSIPTSTPRRTATSRPARRSRSSAWTSSGRCGVAEAAVDDPAASA